MIGKSFSGIDPNEGGVSQYAIHVSEDQAEITRTWELIHDDGFGPDIKIETWTMTPADLRTLIATAQELLQISEKAQQTEWKPLEERLFGPLLTE